MAISEKEIDHLALLARLGVSDEEKKKLGKDLERILAYVGELSKVDVTSIEPMTGGTDLSNRMREDELRKEAVSDPKTLLEEAPTKENGWVKAPRILE